MHMHARSQCVHPYNLNANKCSQRPGSGVWLHTRDCTHVTPCGPALVLVRSAQYAPSPLHRSFPRQKRSQDDVGPYILGRTLVRALRARTHVCSCARGHLCYICARCACEGRKERERVWACRRERGTDPPGACTQRDANECAGPRLDGDSQGRHPQGHGGQGAASNMFTKRMHRKAHLRTRPRSSSAHLIPTRT